MADYPENMDELIETGMQEYWNSPNDDHMNIVTPFQMDVLAKRWKDRLSERFITGSNEFHILRMSAVGKPLIELLYNKIHFDKYLDKWAETSVHSHQRMSVGDTFEIDLAIHLLRMGFTFEDFASGQRELEYKDVRGHTDYIVSHPVWTNGLPILFECKALHSYNWKCASKYVDDKYGYFTQLSLYTKLTGLPGYWLLYNKDTSEITVKSYASQGDESTQQAAIERLDMLILLWEMEDELKWEDVFMYCRPPEPVPEVYKGSFTGNFLIPPSMKFCNCTPTVYILEETKNSYSKPVTYVRDYNYPEAVADLKPDINEAIGGGYDEED